MKPTIVAIISGISAALAVMLLGQRHAVVREIEAPGDGAPALTAQLLDATAPSSGEKLLGQKLPRVSCDAMPLEKFIAWLEQQTGTNIYVEWHELERGAAAGPQSPIALDLRNVTAAAALQLALDQSKIAGEALGFVAVGDVIKVSIASRLDHWTVTRVYDVRDLIEEEVKIGGVARKANPPKTDPTGQFAIPDFEVFKTRDEQAAERLRELLMNCLKREDRPSWRDINYFAGRFVINQTAKNHQTIAAMLAALRAKGK